MRSPIVEVEEVGSKGGHFVEKKKKLKRARGWSMETSLPISLFIFFLLFSRSDTEWKHADLLRNSALRTPVMVAYERI